MLGIKILILLSQRRIRGSFVAVTIAAVLARVASISSATAATLAAASRFARFSSHLRLCLRFTLNIVTKSKNYKKTRIDKD